MESPKLHTAICIGAKTSRDHGMHIVLERSEMRSEVKYCDKCNVRVAGNPEICPLCQKELVEISDDDSILGTKEIYPHVKTIYEAHSMGFRILGFLSVAVITITVMFDLLLSHGITWSIFVIAGVLCFWGSFYAAFHMRKNIPKTMLFQVSFLCMIVFLWDYMTGFHGWSMDYVIPILCLSNLLVLFVLSRIYQQDAEDYMIYLIIGALFGLVPFIFYMAGSLYVKLPSILCTTCSILFITAVIIFQGSRIREELKKRLHI